MNSLHGIEQKYQVASYIPKFGEPATASAGDAAPAVREVVMYH
jgi:hypothetical protein